MGPWAFAEYCNIITSVSFHECGNIGRIHIILVTYKYMYINTVLVAQWNYLLKSSFVKS